MLATRDERVADAALSAAAAVGRTVDVTASARDAYARWASAQAVLVGADMAPALVALGPSHRCDVYVIGTDAAEVAPFSVALAAQVIVVPEGLAALSAVLSDDHGAAPVVAVLAGSGGAGASTLAAGLAMVARSRGLTAALVDLDPIGGGIDLLLGAERTPGWRWPRLLGARGEVTDMRRFLPQVDGLSVVSMGRPAGDEPPSAESVRAVLGSLARHHDVVLVDPGRAPLPSARLAVGNARSTLLVTTSTVRGVAATAGLIKHWELTGPKVVVRASPVSKVPSDVIGQTLGFPVVSVLPHEPKLARAAEQGLPPGRRLRGMWSQSVARLLAEVMRHAG